jgi:hypothetical protein
MTKPKKKKTTTKEQKVQKVFITGCAKSGTTLLRRLFHAFNPDDVEVIDYEIKVNHFVDYVSMNPDVKVIVGKRWGTSVFCMDVGEEETENQLKLLKGISIINIFRDGRAVIMSDNNWVSPERWIYCMDYMLKNKGELTLNIQYEDLILNPDKYQKMIEVMFDITAQFPFSSYPSFFLVQDDLMTLPGVNQDIYRPKPIAEIKADNKYDDNYKECFESFDPNDEAGLVFSDFNDMLIKLEYIEFDTIEEDSNAILDSNGKDRE